RGRLRPTPRAFGEVVRSVSGQAGGGLLAAAQERGQGQTDGEQETHRGNPEGRDRPHHLTGLGGLDGRGGGGEPALGVVGALERVCSRLVEHVYGLGHHFVRTVAEHARSTLATHIHVGLGGVLHTG